jgi:anti-sigma-K factor RskA
VNEPLEEQASLYVLGLLEGSEAAQFERQMESNPALRSLVDELDEAAATLAHDVPARPLPAGLRDRVVGEINRGKKVAFPQRRLNWLPWAIAACLALACSYLVAERTGLRSRVAALEQRDFFAQVQIASLSSKLANVPNANAVVVWDEKKQKGVLKVTQLPANTPNRDYQLWLVDPRYKDPVDGGVFHVSNTGEMSIPFKPNAPVRDAKAFAISLERKGGVTKAEGPIVLLGK